MKKILPCLILFLSGVVTAHAHKRGENYVFLEFHDTFIEGRFEFKYEDVKEKLGIDLFVDGAVSLERIQQTAPQVHEYIRANFSIGATPTEPYEIVYTGASLFKGEGGWAQYDFRIAADPIPPFLYITHEMCYENDRIHRGVVVLEKGDWPAEDYEMLISMVFSPRDPSQVLDVRNPPEVMSPLSMVWQGMLHIWIGIDHILFLLALALPIVLVRDDDKWAPAPSMGQSLVSLLKIVTVFTIAHSITLLLASLDIVTVPSRFVESVIALSIIFVALNNIFGKNHRTSLVAILALGLFHGLGFASVMGELPFRIAETKNFILMILGFNAGVEIGQLAILLLGFPILFVLRAKSFYTPAVLTGGSVALTLVATYWFIERAFAL